MPRAPASSLFLVLLALLSGFLGAPQARAAEQATAEAADAPASPAATSPWEHPLWHDATAMMRIYLCDHARRPPTWCAEPRQLPANVELPEPQGPPLHDEDKRWLAFLEQADPANLSPAEVTTIRRRALERRDPQAMEILGFIYAEGASVERDYAESYRWYGLAFLAGETRVRPNMDVVWQQLQRHDLEGALALTRMFDALAAGQVPPDLLPPATAENRDSAVPVPGAATPDRQ